MRSWRRRGTRFFASGGFSVREAVRRVEGRLAAWDREVLGQLKHRIKYVERELERCRHGPIGQQQVSQEHLLRYKLSCLEDQHNMYWQ